MIIRVMDVATGRVVRKLHGHSDRITDVAFSPDGKLLLTSSMDSTVRVYDVPTARCVDWMRFESPVTSLTFAPTSEYIVTAHVDSGASLPRSHCQSACMTLCASEAHLPAMGRILSPMSYFIGGVCEQWGCTCGRTLHTSTSCCWTSRRLLLVRAPRLPLLCIACGW